MLVKLKYCWITKFDLLAIENIIFLIEIMSAILPMMYYFKATFKSLFLFAWSREQTENFIKLRFYNYLHVNEMSCVVFPFVLFTIFCMMYFLYFRTANIQGQGGAQKMENPQLQLGPGSLSWMRCWATSHPSPILSP